MEVDVREAKTHFSRILERVTEGEEVIIMRSNVPIARLVPISSISSPPKRRKLGWARGEFSVPDDFDAPLPPEIEDSFYIGAEAESSRRRIQPRHRNAHAAPQRAE
jgi:prevent-host-death family protein